MSDTTPIAAFDDVPSLQTALVDAVCDLVSETVRTRGRCNVSLSGGSTPKVLYQRLSERDLPWNDIHWFWGDERNVPHDHDDSNFRMVQNALLHHAPIDASRIHAVPVDVDEPAAAALNYESILREHFGTTVPEWDLVLLGMGDDAHTASLFPETSALQSTERWFLENWVPKFDAYRYTLTAPAINSGRNIWFVITGAAKQQALKKVLSTDRNPTDYPSQLISPTRWFVSSEVMSG